ncbi:MAG: DUF5333 domain-containing protein [Pseudomonadota bacterium]
MRYFLAVLVTAVLFALTFSAAAKPALRDNRAITDGLVAVGVAIEIGEMCNSIAPRTFRGMSYLNSLKDKARDMGYSSEEIDAFVDSKSERARLEARAKDYLASKGAKGPAGDSYCRVGAAEIAAGTAAGRLLRHR